MKLDPRRNRAATTAGIVAIGLFIAIELLEPTRLFNPVRLALLACGFGALAAGMWPSRRGRSTLLLVVTAGFGVIGVLTLWTVGLPVLIAGAIAAYASFIEYTRAPDGREGAV